MTEKKPKVCRKLLMEYEDGDLPQSQTIDFGGEDDDEGTASGATASTVDIAVRRKAQKQGTEEEEDEEEEEEEEEEDFLASIKFNFVLQICGLLYCFLL